MEEITINVDSVRQFTIKLLFPEHSRNMERLMKSIMEQLDHFERVATIEPEEWTQNDMQIARLACATVATLMLHEINRSVIRRPDG